MNDRKRKAILDLNKRILGENVIKEGYPSGSTEIIDELRKDIGDDNLLRIYRLGVEAFRAEHRQQNPPLGSTPKEDN